MADRQNMFTPAHKLVPIELSIFENHNFQVMHTQLVIMFNKTCLIYKCYNIGSNGHMHNNKNALQTQLALHLVIDTLKIS